MLLAFLSPSFGNQRVCTCVSCLCLSPSPVSPLFIGKNWRLQNEYCRAAESQNEVLGIKSLVLIDSQKNGKHYSGMTTSKLLLLLL